MNEGLKSDKSDFSCDETEIKKNDICHAGHFFDVPAISFYLLNFVLF